MDLNYVINNWLDFFLIIKILVSYIGIKIEFVFLIFFGFVSFFFDKSFIWVIVQIFEKYVQQNYQIFIYIVYKSLLYIWIIFQVVKVKREIGILCGFNFLEISKRKEYYCKKSIFKIKLNFEV